MSGKKGTVMLGLMLFLAMFSIPFLALGGNPSSKSGTPSDLQSNPPAVKTGSQFQILDSSTGRMLSVDDKTFLYGAVAAEMSPLAGKEALKAQAVACYTYYSRLRENHRKSPPAELKGADFSADPQTWNIYVTKEMMQSKWGNNFQSYYQSIQDAADSVSGQVLKCNGSLIDATYFAISSGNTEASEDVWGSKCSYLVSVASPLDMFAGGYQTTVTYTEAETKSRILNAAPKANLSGPAADWIGKPVCSASGGVKSIQVGGQSITGNQARTAFGLRSAAFTAAYSDGKFTFTVKGYGHGVGMSQAGAEAMAKQGSNYLQILSWYYPTAVLSSL